MIKNNVKRCFSRSAVTYDENASLQRYIEDRLLEKLCDVSVSPELIVDIGAGTCSGSKKLLAAYPGAKVIACDIAHGMMRYAKDSFRYENKGLHLVTADMEMLPFRDNAFDVVYSSAAAHWLKDIKELFFNVKRLIKDNGVFCFSTFGPDTLFELGQSFDEAYKEAKREKKDHVNRFIPFEEIIGKLRETGFNDIKSEVEAKKVKHLKVMDLLKSLKSIGSHKTCGDSKYIGKELLKRVFDIYEKKYNTKKGIFATYVVYYFICRVQNG